MEQLECFYEGRMSSLQSSGAVYSTIWVLKLRYIHSPSQEIARMHKTANGLTDLTRIERYDKRKP